jgi:hypothetical protein
MATTTHHNTLTQDKANNYNTLLQQPKQALPSLRQGEGTPSLKTASQPTQTLPKHDHGSEVAQTNVPLLMRQEDRRADARIRPNLRKKTARKCW